MTLDCDEIDLEEEGDSWYTEDWDDLPRDVQDAAKLLGYTDWNWVGGVKPLAFSDNWHDLTRKQRKAAILLGLTKEIWEAKYGDQTPL